MPETCFVATTPQVCSMVANYFKGGVMKTLLLVLFMGLVINSGVVSASDVKIVNTSDADWCSYQQNCTYLRSVRCRTSRSNPKLRCDRKLAKDARKFGGDTVVYQSAKLSEEQSSDDDFEPDFVAFGHAYHCAGELDAASKKRLNKIINRPKYRAKVTTHENEQRCDMKNDCKFVREFKCTTTRDRPELRCLKKVYKLARHTPVNKFVIEKEVYTFSKYNVLMRGYQCSFEPNQ